MSAEHFMPYLDPNRLSPYRRQQSIHAFDRFMAGQLTRIKRLGFSNNLETDEIEVITRSMRLGWEVDCLELHELQIESRI